MCGGGVEGGVAGLFDVLDVLGVRAGDGVGAVGDGVGVVGQAGVGDGLCGEPRHSS